MPEPKRTPAGEALTALIPELLRLNNLIVTNGDRLVSGLGLTSARWQILDAIDTAERPQPVAWLARDIGGNRQNVQRIVNDLHRDGLTAFEANPHHRRAQLVVMTDNGRKALAAAMDLQIPWANHVTEGLSVKDMEVVRRVAARLRERIEQAQDADQAEA